MPLPRRLFDRHFHTAPSTAPLPQRPFHSRPFHSRARASAPSRAQRSDAGCIALGDALKARPSKLHTLKLAHNYIGGVGALALADALAHNGTLRTLDLSANEIGSAAALELLSRLLAHANPVQRLRLQGNGIDAQAAAEMRRKLGSTGLAIEI